MDTMTWNEMTQLQQDIRLTQLAVEALQVKANELMGRFYEQTKLEDRPKKFADLEGIWEGANLSYEEIQAAEYKVPQDLLL